MGSNGNSMVQCLFLGFTPVSVTLFSLMYNFLSLLASYPTPVIGLVSRYLGRYGTYFYLPVEYPYYICWIGFGYLAAIKSKVFLSYLYLLGVGWRVRLPQKTPWRLQGRFRYQVPTYLIKNLCRKPSTCWCREGRWPWPTCGPTRPTPYGCRRSTAWGRGASRRPCGWPPGPCPPPRPAWSAPAPPITLSSSSGPMVSVRDSSMRFSNSDFSGINSTKLGPRFTP